MTLDGFCDHTLLSPKEDVHQHYQKLLDEGELILYGRKTFQLMEFWREFLENPSSEKSMNDFAQSIDRIPKLVFTHTLSQVDWPTAEIAQKSLEEEVKERKAQTSQNIYVGSRSLINQLLQLNLLDELQICIHPQLSSQGLPLFDLANQPISLHLHHIQNLEGGAVILYYQPLPFP